jgi:hypothetical protein
LRDKKLHFKYNTKYLLLFFGVLESEFMASDCDSGTLPVEPHLQAFMLWLFWRWDLTFCPGQPWPWSFYFKLPTFTGMTDAYHHTQLFSIKMGVLKTYFFLGWPGVVSLSVSAFHVAWEDKHHKHMLQCTAIACHGILLTFFPPSLALNWDPPDLGLPRT